MRVLLTLATLVVSALLLITPAVQAEIPPLLAWQGVALDSLDNPLGDGSYLFYFSIWSDDVSGDSLWGEARVVDVQQGVINVLLGEVMSLPDTLFDLANRWLQVQFESEDPYFPRTRIVSVGYAFRVEKLQGAMGGEVRSDILLKDQFSFPALRLFREGTNTQIASLFGGGQGGYFGLADGTGSPTFEVTPDDNGGAEMVLYTHESQFTGIAAYNDGTDNPQLLIAGANSMAFNAGVGGDASVEVPNDAISAPEILDEPGIASGERRSPSAIGSTDSLLCTVTVTFPDSGWAVIIGEATLNNHTEATWVTASLYRGGAQQSYWWWDGGDVDTYYDQRQSFTYTQQVPGGTFTYDLRARCSAGGSMDATHTKLVVMYFPTAYGTVATPLATSVAREIDAASGRQIVPAAAVIDPATDRAASIEFNEERIRREVEEMKNRLAQLEAKLQARGESTPVDR